ncbi:hypothetical protein TNCV_3058241 [Trichonephila clavipes]|nr:hypothetical protein TNCV_3058241 [Trichonephila clavipes]
MGIGKHSTEQEVTLLQRETRIQYGQYQKTSSFIMGNDDTASNMPWKKINKRSIHCLKNRYNLLLIIYADLSPTMTIVAHANDDKSLDLLDQCKVRKHRKPE